MSKLTELTELTSLTDGDILYTVNSPGTTPESKKVAASVLKSYMQNLVLKGYSETVNVLGNVSGQQTINLQLGNVVTATSVGDTLWVFSNPPTTGNTGTITLILTNGGVGTQYWPTTVKWSDGEPTLTSSGTDIIIFVTTNGGTTWYGVLSGLNFSSPTFQTNQVLLLNFNGADATTSTIDAAVGGSAPHSFTFVNSAQLDTGIKKFGTASLILSDDTEDYIYAADSNDWYLSGDFTIRAWIYMPEALAPNTTYVIVCQYDPGTDKWWHFVVQRNGSDPPELYFASYNGASYLISTHTTFSYSQSTWYLVEVGRNNDDWYLFINGDSKSLTLDSGSYSCTLENINANLYIGYEYGWSPFSGNIDSLQIFNGQCLHTSSYTPDATEPSR